MESDLKKNLLANQFVKKKINDKHNSHIDLFIFWRLAINNYKI
jgi:hypothetical protein